MILSGISTLDSEEYNKERQFLWTNGLEKNACGYLETIFHYCREGNETIRSSIHCITIDIIL